MAKLPDSHLGAYMAVHADEIEGHLEAMGLEPLESDKEIKRMSYLVEDGHYHSVWVSRSKEFNSSDWLRLV